MKKIIIVLTLTLLTILIWSLATHKTDAVIFTVSFYSLILLATLVGIYLIIKPRIKIQRLSKQKRFEKLTGFFKARYKLKYIKLKTLLHLFYWDFFIHGRFLVFLEIRSSVHKIEGAYKITKNTSDEEIKLHLVNFGWC